MSDKAEENNNNNSLEKKNVAFHSHGIFVDQNIRHRRRMEDAHYVEDKFLGKDHAAFFGVYDGHGGKEAADFASKTFHTVLAEKINSKGESVFDNPKDIAEIFVETYSGTDDQIKTNCPSHHGCTAVTCLIWGEGEKRHLYCANAGDARAVLCRNGKAVRLTYDHKASDEDEKNRILEAGGFVINGRVNGQIIITRSLGDHLMKDYIINTPYQQDTPLNNDDTFLIVACDGLWDVIEDQAACDFLLENSTLPSSELATLLGRNALQSGTTDNLSIIVIRL